MVVILKKHESLEQLNDVLATYIKLPLTISHDALFDGVYEVVSSLRPQWPKGQLKLKEFAEGTTNKLVLVSYGSDPSERMLVRVYGIGTDSIIDREQELVNLLSLNMADHGPMLFGTFTNGYCYGFLEGRALDVEDLSIPDLAFLIAERLASFHHIHLPGDSSPMLFRTMRKWLEAAPTEFKDPIKQKKLSSIDMKLIESEMTSLESVLVSLNSPVVFCHNDLLCKNVILNDADNSVSFIDYEYACYNYQGFDIGNHFCEFAGMGEVDYTRYPDKEFQLKWLRSYLSAFNESDGKITDEEVHMFYCEVNKFALASHLYWGIWALVQAANSDIDYDFLNFSRIRFAEYFNRRDEFLALS